MRTNKLVTEKQAYEAMRLAQIHAETSTKDMVSSARSVVQDVESLFNKGDFRCAYERALDSLRYSVGCFHPDFSKALAL